jgi:hypothetical protein
MLYPTLTVDELTRELRSERVDEKMITRSTQALTYVRR